MSNGTYKGSACVRAHFKQYANPSLKQLPVVKNYHYVVIQSHPTEAKQLKKCRTTSYMRCFVIERKVLVKLCHPLRKHSLPNNMAINSPYLTTSVYRTHDTGQKLLTASKIPTTVLTTSQKHPTEKTTL